jgi:hypothetical protein
VRHLFQPEVAAQVRAVLQVGDDAAVIGLQERLEGEDREQLVLGEVLA